MCVPGPSRWSAAARGSSVGPSLVLTARHVVAGERGQWPRIVVFIGHPSGGTVAPAVREVCWQDQDRDVALLRIDPLPGMGAPVRWGRPVGEDYLDYTGMGFPLLADYSDGSRWVEPLSGRLSALSLDPDGYALNQEYAPMTGGRGWHGVSGAAVFVDGLLIAVITKDQRQFGPQRLRAMPVFTFLQDPRFAQLVRKDTGSRPVAEPVELARYLDCRMEPAQAGTPGSLLAAAVEAVAFHGRDRVLSALTAWRDGQSGFSIMLVTGEGGQGKTRLAREFTRRSQASGYVSGFTTKPREPLSDQEQRDRGGQFAQRLSGVRARPGGVGLRGVERGLHHQDDRRDSGGQAARPVRLLLLARMAGAWWEKLRDSLSDITTALELAPLAIDAAAQRATYLAAVQGLAPGLAELPSPAVEGGPVLPWAALAGQLTGNPPVLPQGFSNALTVHMTALLDLLQLASARSGSPRETGQNQTSSGTSGLPGTRRGGAAPVPGGPAVGGWRHSQRHREVQRRLDRSLAGLILLGSCDFRLANAIGRLADRAHAADVVTWLATLYPPSAGERATLGQVQPDRLAEHLLGGILTATTVVDGADVRLHPRLVAEIGALVPDLDMAQSALFALVRTATHERFSDVVREQIIELIVQRPDPFATVAPLLAVSTDHPEPLLTGLYTLADRDHRALHGQVVRTSGLLPDRSVSLAFFTADVSALIVGILRLVADRDHGARRWLRRFAAIPTGSRTWAAGGSGRCRRRGCQHAQGAG